MLSQILATLGYEKRSTEYNPAFAPGNWGRGVMPAPYASPDAVLSNLAVAARCVSLRSELLASVPLKLYRKLPNGDRMRLYGNPLGNVLGDLANALMTAFELREFLVRSLDLAGNAFARIDRDNGGQVVALWPLPASSVTVERLENGRLRYRVNQNGKRGPVNLLQEEILHIRASSEDGLLGRSPIAIARGSLGLAIAQANTSQSLVNQGLRPAGVLTHPGKLSAVAKTNIADSVSDHNAGPANAGKPLVLEEGMIWSEGAFSAEDSELLSSRVLSNEDCARVFGVPGGAVGIRDSVSYGSAEADARALVQNTLQPLAERVEQAMMRCLLTPEGREQFVIEHDLRGLLRGDMAQRFAAYRIGREIGIYSANEIRKIENETAIEGGDTYLQPVTLAGSSTPNDGGSTTK